MMSDKSASEHTKDFLYHLAVFYVILCYSPQQIFSKFFEHKKGRINVLYLAKLKAQLKKKN